MTPRPILTAAGMRAAEEAVIAAGTSVETLMERAGHAVARAAHAFSGGAPALVLCGPGNNGGDGYVAARCLRALGVAVRVACTGAPTTEAARAAAAAWGGPAEALADAISAPVLIDCLFGTGLTRPLAPDISAALARLAAAARFTVAVDVPSGIASDDGAILSPVPRFDCTVALGALKPAHLLQPAASRCGRLIVADIGLGELASQSAEIARPHLRAPGPADHKYTRGVIAVVAGVMGGAALLAASAAQRAGAGYVSVVGGPGGGGPHALVHRQAADPASVAELLADKRIGAIVVGPGLGRGIDARARLDAALAADRPIVIDADAIMLLAGAAERLAGLSAPAILTPHEGEFADMFGTIGGSKIDRVRAAALRCGQTVVLKGADSVVAHPDGRAAIAPSAPAWLASAGTGDVLAGITGAMLARGIDPFDAACAALWLHGEAARAAGPALIADDLVAHLSLLLGACA
ncbi:MAG: carbohydrate kinase, YjeF-like protein [Sphingomonas bacterium]|nr:NAD(P)H-hydrate dehydratase [Sphingomonas bacterium]MDB5690031.1 carbohydrate kinase, YjeF-like protein [Sphingomonas bacterium]